MKYQDWLVITLILLKPNSLDVSLALVLKSTFSWEVKDPRRSSYTSKRRRSRATLLDDERGEWCVRERKDFPSFAKASAGKESDLSLTLVTKLKHLSRSQVI